MAQRTWRDSAKAAIQKALQEAEAQGLDAEATRTYVNAAYPFGPREYWPYQAWLKAVRQALGLPKRARGNKAETPLFRDDD